jgi:hypothetical protein
MDIPGDFSRLVYSADQVRAALKMSWIYRAGSTPSTMHKIKRYIISRQRDIASSINMTMVWVVFWSLADLAGCKAGDRFTFGRHARYPQLYQIVKLGPEGGECPLWISCVLTASVFVKTLSRKWLQSTNRKLLES